MAKQIFSNAKKAKQVKLFTTQGQEVLGCAHIVGVGMLPPNGKTDDFGDSYIDTVKRETFVQAYWQGKAEVEFSNTSKDFDTWFDADTKNARADNKEIMFYLADPSAPNPQTDGWRKYDAKDIQTNQGLYFILQRKFFDGNFPRRPYPSDGFDFIAYSSIATRIGKQKDGRVCILICIKDNLGNIIDRPIGGDPDGVGVKVPPDPE
jgi:hypothetical protein